MVQVWQRWRLMLKVRLAWLLSLHKREMRNLFLYSVLGSIFPPLSCVWSSLPERLVIEPNSVLDMFFVKELKPTLNKQCYSIRAKLFSVFMWCHHIPKLEITFLSEVSVPSNKRPYKTLTFYNVLAQQGSSFCNSARLNFQAFALRDTKVAAQESCRIGQSMCQKMSYHFSFC